MLERLTSRWHLKVLSLGLAFAVWVAVTGEGRAVQDFSVPVEVSLGAHATLAGPAPLKVSVRLRAPESILRRIDPYDLDVRVDLRDAPPGERTVALAHRGGLFAPPPECSTSGAPQRALTVLSLFGRFS